MKKHAIIPVFIPHLGCGNSCVFCNQRIITARSVPVTGKEVRDQIETYLSTLRSRNLEKIEIAFYGGSFTGIPMEEQTEFLKIAREYLDSGQVDGIHLSTRPDYIDEEILDNLKRYGVKVIELGVQSFSDSVLKASKRGHTSEQVYRSAEMIKSRGFSLGIQLMTGLPGDSEELCLMSAEKAASLKPDLARLYPTVVFPDTELAEMYRDGRYVPFSEEEHIRICKGMYRILNDAGVYIMRVGLKSTDLVNSTADMSSEYHPAFRQLVEGEIAKDDIEKQLLAFLDDETLMSDTEGKVRFTASCAPASFSNMIGHKKCNRIYFSSRYDRADIKFTVDRTLPDGVYLLRRSSVK